MMSKVYSTIGTKIDSLKENMKVKNYVTIVRHGDIVLLKRFLPNNTEIPSYAIERTPERLHFSTKLDCYSALYRRMS